MMRMRMRATTMMPTGADDIPLEVHGGRMGPSPEQEEICSKSDQMESGN